MMVIVVRVFTEMSHVKVSFVWFERFVRAQLNNRKPECTKLENINILSLYTAS